MPTDVPKLDDQLCFLVYRLHRGITDLYRPVLADLGLTYPQYLVMLVVWESSPISVRDIGDRLRLDSGTLSPLLKRLEVAGLITRARDAADERSVLVSLSPAGRSLARSACAVPSAVLGSMTASDADARGLHNLLAGLVSSVDSEVAKRSSVTPA